MRGWPLVRRSPRITRIEANTNSQSSARKPNLINCTARAEFMRRSHRLLVKDQPGVANAYDVAMP